MSEQANFDYSPALDEDTLAMMRMDEDGYTPPAPAERKVRWLSLQEPDPLQIETFEGEGGLFN